MRGERREKEREREKGKEREKEGKIIGREKLSERECDI